MQVAYKLSAVLQYFCIKFLNEVNVLPCQKLHYNSMWLTLTVVAYSQFTIMSHDLLISTYVHMYLQHLRTIHSKAPICHSLL